MKLDNIAFVVRSCQMTIGRPTVIVLDKRILLRFHSAWI